MKTTRVTLLLCLIVLSATIYAESGISVAANPPDPDETHPSSVDISVYEWGGVVRSPIGQDPAAPAIVFIINQNEDFKGTFSSNLICKAKVDSQGFFRFTDVMKPGMFQDPPGPCTSLKVKFCPVVSDSVQLADCLDLIDKFPSSPNYGKRYSPVSLNAIPECSQAQSGTMNLPPPTGVTFDHPDNSMVSSSVRYCSQGSVGFGALQPLCAPLMLLFGLLMGAMFILGRSPFSFFDISTKPRFSRGGQYQMRRMTKLDLSSQIMQQAAQGLASYAMSAGMGAAEKRIAGSGRKAGTLEGATADKTGATAAKGDAGVNTPASANKKIETGDKALANGKQLQAQALDAKKVAAAAESKGEKGAVALRKTAVDLDKKAGVEFGKASANYKSATKDINNAMPLKNIENAAASQSPAQQASSSMMVGRVGLKGAMPKGGWADQAGLSVNPETHGKANKGKKAGQGEPKSLLAAYVKPDAKQSTQINVQTPATAPKQGFRLGGKSAGLWLKRILPYPFGSILSGDFKEVIPFLPTRDRTTGKKTHFSGGILEKAYKEFAAYPKGYVSNVSKITGIHLDKAERELVKYERGMKKYRNTQTEELKKIDATLKSGLSDGQLRMNSSQLSDVYRIKPGESTANYRKRLTEEAQTIRLWLNGASSAPDEKGKRMEDAIKSRRSQIQMGIQQMSAGGDYGNLLNITKVLHLATVVANQARAEFREGVVRQEIQILQQLLNKQTDYNSATTDVKKKKAILDSCLAELKQGGMDIGEKRLAKLFGLAKDVAKDENKTIAAIADRINSLRSGATGKSPTADPVFSDIHDIAFHSEVHRVSREGLSQMGGWQGDLKEAYRRSFGRVVDFYLLPVRAVDFTKTLLSGDERGIEHAVRSRVEINTHYIGRARGRQDDVAAFEHCQSLATPEERTEYLAKHGKEVKSGLKFLSRQAGQVLPGLQAELQKRYLTITKSLAEQDVNVLSTSDLTIQEREQVAAAGVVTGKYVELERTQDGRFYFVHAVPDASSADGRKLDRVYLYAHVAALSGDGRHLDAVVAASQLNMQGRGAEALQEARAIMASMEALSSLTQAASGFSANYSNIAEERRQEAAYLGNSLAAGKGLSKELKSPEWDMAWSSYSGIIENPQSTLQERQSAAQKVGELADGFRSSPAVKDNQELQIQLAQVSENAQGYSSVMQGHRVAELTARAATYALSGYTGMVTGTADPYDSLTQAAAGKFIMGQLNELSMAKANGDDATSSFITKQVLPYLTEPGGLEQDLSTGASMTTLAKLERFEELRHALDVANWIKPDEVLSHMEAAVPEHPHDSMPEMERSGALPERDPARVYGSFLAQVGNLADTFNSLAGDFKPSSSMTESKIDDLRDMVHTMYGLKTAIDAGVLRPEKVASAWNEAMNMITAGSRAAGASSSQKDYFTARDELNGIILRAYEENPVPKAKGGQPPSPPPPRYALKIKDEEVGV